MEYNYKRLCNSLNKYSGGHWLETIELELRFFLSLYVSGETVCKAKAAINIRQLVSTRNVVAAGSRKLRHTNFGVL